MIENFSITLGDHIYLIEETVLQVGQADNAISYHRHLNVLSRFMSASPAKSTLKDRGKILQIHDKDLFGKEFCYHLVESVKVKKQYKIHPKRRRYLRLLSFHNGSPRESAQNEREPLRIYEHYDKGFEPGNSKIPGCNLA